MDKPLNAQKIAFGIVPRINAAGRMGSAKLAAELLLCEDEERALPNWRGKWTPSM